MQNLRAVGGDAWANIDVSDGLCDTRTDRCVHLERRIVFFVVM